MGIAHRSQIQYIIALFPSASLQCILLSHTRNPILFAEQRIDVMR